MTKHHKSWNFCGVGITFAGNIVGYAYNELRIRDQGNHMEHFHNEEMARLRELLRHAGEFIAYFELAESKMMDWRQSIEQQQHLQEQAIARQFLQLRTELQALQGVLTEAGIGRLRTHSDDVLKQGESCLNLLQTTGSQLLASMSVQQQEFSQLVTRSLEQLNRHSSHADEHDNRSLYNAEQFRHIASNTCEHVEKVAKETLQKSAGLWRNIQWHASALALATTFFTAFAIGLYINNEMPWEIHKKASNEREAGKALLKAWPGLSQQERNKIMQKNG